MIQVVVWVDFLRSTHMMNFDNDYWLKKFIKERYDNPKQYLVVDTDWCHNATIAWIIENLNAINADFL